jgi:NIPSNAP
MIIDERTYSLQPGLVGAYLDNHLKNALPIMRQYLGEPFGYFLTETGDLNQFVHLWRYEDMADRERRRKAMYDDPRWVAYQANTGERGLVTHQHNRILRAIDIPNSASPRS